MSNDPLNLGELQSAHRPSVIRLWIMAVIALALLSGVLLGALLTVDSFSNQTGKDTFGRASSPLACLGASALCFLIIASFLISDFRKWWTTRTVWLKIYSEGLSYESNGQSEVFRWNQIKDINFKVIEISSKHSRPRKTRVIRSIARVDGTVVMLAETLNLIKITELITKVQGLQ